MPRQVVVNTTGRDDGVLDAIAYIVRRAEQAGAAAVINLSYTRHDGAHDGTDLLTRAIDAILGKRALLVVSVGNDGQRDRYTRIDPHNDPALAFRVHDRGCGGSEDAGFAFEVEGWYDASMEPEFSLVQPDGARRAVRTDKGVGAWQTSAGNILMDTTLVSAGGSKKGIFLSIEGACRQLIEARWELEVKAAPGGRGEFEAWIRRAAACDVAFQSGHPGSGLSSFAAGRRVLSVGAWHQDPVRGAIEREPHSSHGYTGDGRRKPDVLAPGTATYVVTSLGDAPTAQGTSAAAALVTRVIAHLWQARTDLDAPAIQRLIQGTMLVPGLSLRFVSSISGYDAITLEELEQRLRRAPRASPARSRSSPRGSNGTRAPRHRCGSPTGPTQ